MNQQACRIMAKDLVRTRKYIQKFYAMKTQLQAVELRIQVRCSPSSLPTPHPLTSIQPN